MQPIEVREAPKRSQVTKEGPPSASMRFGYDGMAAGEIRARWIIMGHIKHGGQVDLGII